MPADCSIALVCYLALFSICWSNKALQLKIYIIILVFKAFSNLQIMTRFGFLLFLSLHLLPYKSFSQLIINELMASNATTHYETDFYNFPDYIEIYNTASNNILLANYYISDDIESLKKWKLPNVYIVTKQYYLIYCDKKATGRHTNFGLSADGESIFLSDNAGNIIDQVKYGRQYTDISYGRDPIETYRWFYCSTPTPGAANIVIPGSEQISKAEYSVPAGRISSTTPLTLTGNNIKYTITGAEPKAGSLSYTFPFNINKTMIVKAKNYLDNFVPSKTYANTYFYNEHNFTLPVVSISYNPEFFNDNTIGIYIVGTNGIDGNCYGRANWNQNWERGAYLEYFDEEGVKKISQPVGVKIAGGCSRSFTNQKSLSIYARGKYGNSDFDYPFFKEKPDIVRSKSLLLRNSGNDVNVTQLRDAFLQTLVSSSIDLDYQAYQPVIAYFNGVYWGIMNIREKTNEDYFYGNYALSDDSIDFLEGNLRSGTNYNYSAIRGTTNDFNNIITYLSSNSLVSDENYNFIASQLDLQEYLNYMAVQIYYANTDWPGNNLKFWKKSTDGKWRWILYDTDFGFGYVSADHNTIAFASATNGPDWPNPPWSTLLFRKLMENEHFRKEFIRTILTLRDAAFHPEWCNYVMDSLAARIDFEISYHKAKWGGNKNDWYNGMNSLKNYALARYNFIPGYISSYFNLTGEQVIVTINNSETSKGHVAVNESVIMHYPFSMTTYKEIDLSIKALPAKGYSFSHWEYAIQTNTKSIIETGSEWSYLDLAGDYPANWNTLSFDESSWSKGLAKLGYGDGDEQTVISYGPDSNNKIPAALFRKRFMVADTSAMIDLQLGLTVDDGAIVYINGQEVFRYNMPAGSVLFNTYASSAIEVTSLSAKIDKHLLNIGENSIACEVHQANGTSSDLAFDFSLSYTYTESADTGIYSFNSFIRSDTSFNISLEPLFEPIEKSEGVFLNEIASVSSLFRDEYNEKSGFVELFNSTGNNIALYSFFLSDKKDNLTRYAIPDSTVIPAYGFITFYLDGEAKQGKYHAPFKADPDGESMILSQKVGSVIHVVDSVSFSELFENRSFGRYEDGTGEWQYMVNITPGQPNDPDRFVNQPEHDAISLNVRIYPNPSDGSINISVDDYDLQSQYYSFDVVDISGKILYPKVWLNSQNNQVNLSYLNGGLYFVRIFKDRQMINTSKLVIVK